MSVWSVDRKEKHLQVAVPNIGKAHRSDLNNLVHVRDDPAI